MVPAGEVWQPLEPPPQFGIPDEPIRDAPIIRMTVPRIVIEIND